MSESPQRNPSYVLLTSLMRRWIVVSVALLALFSVGELTAPGTHHPGTPHWVALVWIFGTRLSLGLAVGALLIALLLLQQRSSLGRR